MVVTGVGCPYSSTKILVEIWFFLMNRSPTITAWYVHAIYHAAEGIDPASTPFLICCSVSSVCLYYDPLYLVRGWCLQAVLSLSMWWGRRENCTLRLPFRAPLGIALAWAWSRLCGRAVPTSRLHILSMNSSASTWLVSGV